MLKWDDKFKSELSIYKMKNFFYKEDKQIYSSNF